MKLRKTIVVDGKREPVLRNEVYFNDMGEGGFDDATQTEIIIGVYELCVYIPPQGNEVERWLEFNQWHEQDEEGNPTPDLDDDAAIQWVIEDNAYPQFSRVHYNFYNDLGILEYDSFAV